MMRLRESKHILQICKYGLTPKAGLLACELLHDIKHQADAQNGLSSNEIKIFLIASVLAKQ